MLQTGKSVRALALTGFRAALGFASQVGQSLRLLDSLSATRGIRDVPSSQNRGPVHVDALRLPMRMQAGQADWRMAAAFARPIAHPLPQPRLQTCGCAPSTAQGLAASDALALRDPQRSVMA